MDDDARDAHYPLYLHALSVEEQQLLLFCVRQAKIEKLFNQELAKRKTGLDFHNLIGAVRRNSGPEKETPLPADKGVGSRGSASPALWAALYNYVMAECRPLWRISGSALLQDKMAELEALGENSGRYRNDIHRFNRTLLDLHPDALRLHENFLQGPYVGFRYRSDAKTIVVFALEFFRDEVHGRYAYRTRVISDKAKQETKGLVYDFRPYITLFGFNEHHSGEFMYLRADDGDYDRVYGMITMPTSAGSPHAKQCLLVRGVRLVGVDAPFNIRHANHIRALQDAQATFLYKDKDGRTVVHLNTGGWIPLARYVQPGNISIRNTPGEDSEVPDGPVY